MEVSKQKWDRKLSLQLLGFSLVTFYLFAHLATWGSYPIAGPILKAKQALGISPRATNLELASICIDLQNWDCAKSAYYNLYHSGDTTGLIHLGRLQMRLKETDAAYITFDRYFQVDGRDITAARDFGKILEDKGQNTLSLQYFEKSIDPNSTTLPIHATGGIIRVLMKQGMHDEAYQRILDFHELADNAKGYFIPEFEKLQTLVKGKARRPAGQRKR
jgi:tetratricopeptide (TPR) repeat protein